MATAVSRAKVLVESLMDRTVTATKVGNIVKGYMNFPEGTNEDVAQAFLDQIKSAMRSTHCSHSEQKQRALDESAAKMAGDAAMTDFDV